MLRRWVWSLSHAHARQRRLPLAHTALGSGKRTRQAVPREALCRVARSRSAVSLVSPDERNKGAECQARGVDLSLRVRAGRAQRGTHASCMHETHERGSGLPTRLECLSPHTLATRCAGGGSAHCLSDALHHLMQGRRGRPSMPARGAQLKLCRHCKGKGQLSFFNAHQEKTYGKCLCVHAECCVWASKACGACAVQPPTQPPTHPCQRQLCTHTYPHFSRVRCWGNTCQCSNRLCAHRCMQVLCQASDRREDGPRRPPAVPLRAGRPQCALPLRHSS